MRKGFVITVCAFASGLLLLVGYYSWPVQYAITKEELKQENRPYYLIQWIQTTGASWQMIGDQNGYFDKPVLIEIIGGGPPVVDNYDVATGQNTFVCYGTKVGVEETDSIYLEIYDFTGWDILYPVRRNYTFDALLPKSYLSRFDVGS